MTKPKNRFENRAVDGSTPTKQGEADDQPAYFLSLSLENVRCFGPKQTLDLSDGNGRPARWTVMLGVNGTGKTTVLQALFAFQKLSEDRSADKIDDFRTFSSQYTS